jgi:DNA-directed RNA polymerase specialized sigma24 family protein
MTNQPTEFMALYEPLHQRLSNYCRSMARNRADAEDLLHDTVVAAYSQFGELEIPTVLPDTFSPLPATCLRNSSEEKNSAEGTMKRQHC